MRYFICPQNLFFLILITYICLSIISCTKKAEWIILFDGTSTDTWRGFQRLDFPVDGWKIENGSLKTIVGGDQCDIIYSLRVRISLLMSFLLMLESN